jgi:DNA processing protein
MSRPAPDPAWVALSLTGHIGRKKLDALLTRFGSARAVLRADATALRCVPGVGAKIAQAIRAIDLNAVERQMAAWTAAGVTLLTSNYAGSYPPNLDSLDDAPPTLFLRGYVDALYRGRRVAVVGTRQPTPAALALARRLGARLAERGVTVVSGLALGIDAAAHEGALQAGGWTLAVLGCGVLNVYPATHRPLAARVMARGLLLSEVHPHAEPSPAALVARNRLISGLCDTVIVVETGADGGAMHAARWAAAQGRRVVAWDSPASGNQQLLANGARRLYDDLSDLEA